MVQISLQTSGGKVVFLGGSMESPFGTNGSKSTLVTFKWPWYFYYLKVLKRVYNFMSPSKQPQTCIKIGVSVFLSKWLEIWHLSANYWWRYNFSNYRSSLLIKKTLWYIRMYTLQTQDRRVLASVSQIRYS